MRKKNRHFRILKLIDSDRITCQQDILDALHDDGVEISQSTLSKDLKELGIIKIRGKDSKFKFIQTRERDTYHTGLMLKRELGDFLREIVPVGNLVLLKTTAGNASGVSKSVDDMGWPEIKGTLASVDTVLVVTETPGTAAIVEEKLRQVIMD